MTEIFASHPSVWACILFPCMIRIIQITMDTIIHALNHSKTPSFGCDVDYKFQQVMNLLSIAFLGWFCFSLNQYEFTNNESYVLQLYRAATVDLPSYAWSIDWITAFGIITTGYFIQWYRNRKMINKSTSIVHMLISSIILSPGNLIIGLPDRFVVYRHSWLKVLMILGIIGQLILWAIPVVYFQWSQGNFFFDHFMPNNSNMNPINQFIIGSVVLIYIRLVWKLTRETREEPEESHELIHPSYHILQEIRWITGCIVAFSDVSLYMLVFGVIITDDCTIITEDCTNDLITANDAKASGAKANETRKQK